MFSKGGGLLRIFKSFSLFLDLLLRITPSPLFPPIYLSSFDCSIGKNLQIHQPICYSTRSRDPRSRTSVRGGLRRQRAEAVVAWVAARGYPSQPTEESRSLSGGATRSTVLNQQFLLPSERERSRPRTLRPFAFHARFSSSRRLLLFPRSFDRSFVLDPRENLPDLGPERDARRFIGSGRKRGTREGGWRRIIIQWRRGGYLHSTYNIFEQ